MSQESRRRKRMARETVVSRNVGKGKIGWGICILAVIGIACAAHFWRGHWMPHPKQTPAASTVGFKAPTSFLELCEVKTNDLDKCDIALMNLLCAEGLRGSENLDIKECLNRLDGFAKYVDGEIQRHIYKFREHPEEFNHMEGYYRMMMMVTVLQQDLGIHYNPQRMQSPSGHIEPNEKFFADSKDVFIHGLTRNQGMGTCSSMPVFLVSIGRRLGYPLKLVKAKGHLFVRWDDGREKFNIEGTSQGFLSYQNEYYRTWPVSFTPEEEQSESFLKNLTPAQELSVFLSTRGMCLEAMGEYRKALGAFAHAYYREPQSRANQLLFARMERLALQAEMPVTRRALYTESSQITIPQGPRHDYLASQRATFQTMLLKPDISDAELETEWAALRAEIIQPQQHH
jgi:hypothetical protein